MQCNNHCLAVLRFSSEVLISRIEPCQTAIAKGQFNKRWDAISSSSSHIRHLLEAGIPLLFRFTKTGTLLCRNFQMNVRIFKGNLTFQINFHTAGHLCVQLDMDKPIWNHVIIGNFTQHIQYENLPTLC